MVVKIKMADILLISRVRTEQKIAKNMARIAGSHLLFAKLNITLNMHCRR